MINNFLHIPCFILLTILLSDQVFDEKMPGENLFPLQVQSVVLTVNCHFIILLF